LNKVTKNNDLVINLLDRPDLESFWQSQIIGNKDPLFAKQLQALVNNYYPGGWNSFSYFISELILSFKNTDYFTLVLKLCGLNSDMCVLDAGCGAGQMLKSASEMGCSNLFGVDADPIAIHIARNFGICHHFYPQLSQSSIEELHFPKDFFDIILCRGVIMYCDAKKAIEEFSRCLKIGGRLFLMVHRDRYYLSKAFESLKGYRFSEIVRYFLIVMNARLMQFDPAFQQQTSRTHGYCEHSVPLNWLRKILAAAGFEVQWIGTRNMTTWEVLALKI
jgi:SAM-dependent methyltransferase